MRKDPKNPSTPLRFARLVERGLRSDLRRLRDELLSEESRLTALEEIRGHCMQDFEERSESGVTTTQAALYYTLFHHLTQEIDLQGRLLGNVRRRLREKKAAVASAAQDREVAEHQRTKPHPAFRVPPLPKTKVS